VEETNYGVVIVHWDDVKFVIRHLAVGGAVLEDAAFAPIEAEP